MVPKQLAVLVLGLAVQDTTPITPASAFVAGLDEVSTFLLEREYERADAALKELLREHADEPIALLYRPRIADLVRTTDFLLGYVQPKPAELVSGELLRYAPSSGQLRILYRRETLQDFYLQAGNVSSAPMERVPKRDDVLYHPAKFARSYSITIRGDEYDPQRLPFLTVICGVNPIEGYAVHFGKPGSQRRDEYAAIFRVGRGYSRIDVQRPPDASRGPYELEVKISEREIRGYFGGKRILRGEKPSKQLGGFGLMGIDPSVTEIEVSGTVQRSWMRGLADAHFHERLALAESRDDSALPAPLRMVGDAGESRSVAAMFDEIPGPELTGQHELLRSAVDRLESESLDASLAFVAGLGTTKTSEEFRAYATCIVRYLSGELTEALEQCERVLALDEEFVFGSILRGNIIQRASGMDAAADAFAQLLEANPTDERCYASAAEAQLMLSHPERVGEILRSGVERGVYGPWMDRVNGLRLKALAGPIWLERFEYKSKHFHVVSDIDRRTCVEAARILETAVDHYSAHLLPLPKGTKERSQVFIFAGEAGYLDYIRDTTEFEPENSLGMFFPALKQLLIWNSPDREEMMRTVRHEGLHQYLDRLTGSRASTWLHEGLAVYWENVDFTKGRSAQDVPTARNIAALRIFRNYFVDWNDLVAMTSERFRWRSGLHYTQSWAFVHFLMNDGRETRNLLRGLLGDLAAGMSAEDARERAFGKLDEPEFEARFRAHVRQIYDDK